LSRIEILRADVAFWRKCDRDLGPAGAAANDCCVVEFDQAGEHGDEVVIPRRREPDRVRLDVEHRIEPLLRLRAALLESKHIYADYERTLVEQELRGYGIDLDNLSSVPADGGVREGKR
jgi:hypothetical protein